MGDVLPPKIGPALSVAERLRANIVKAQQRRTQDLVFPNSEELHILFRPLDDFTELHDVLNPEKLAGMAEGTAEVQAAINTLAASSVDSYAVIDGDRVDIGLPLGLKLYDYIFPVEDGEIRPQTDGEAISLMFGGDTVALVMFARKLDVWRKIQSALVESEPGKS